MADELAPRDTSHLDPASRRVGTVLDGKWTLERLLGVGGMAAVYAGTHRNGARAAIKLFPFSVTTSAEFAERILREGYLANKIGHPAVVRVLDDHLDREREYAYLVMELLEGETARQRVERGGPMSPLEATKFMLELTDCLAAAHDKGVVHRDIKPENIFLTEEGRLKVLDFGVARALDGTSSSVTRTGALLGTPAYMSPEQARGRPSEVGTRSDLYSAGATLLFLVGGEFLHEGESAQEIMVRAAWTPAKKIGERALGIPERLASIIDKACEFDPKDRYQTAGEMRRDLELTLAAMEGDPGAASPVARTSKIPIRGPISTAPIALGRPIGDGAATVADGIAAPDDPSVTSVIPGRRRVTGWAGGAAITVVVAAAVGLWSAWPAPSHPTTTVATSSATAHSLAPTAAAEHAAPPPPAPVPVAPAPSVPDEPAVLSPPSSAPKSRPGPTGPRGKPTAPPPRPGAPVAGAPARPGAALTAPTAQPARSSVGPRAGVVTGRDVGY